MTFLAASFLVFFNDLLSNSPADDLLWEWDLSFLDSLLDDFLDEFPPKLWVLYKLLLGHPDLFCFYGRRISANILALCHKIPYVLNSMVNNKK